VCANDYRKVKIDFASDHLDKSINRIGGDATRLKRERGAVSKPLRTLYLSKERLSQIYSEWTSGSIPVLQIAVSVFRWKSQCILWVSLFPSLCWVILPTQSNWREMGIFRCLLLRLFRCFYFLKLVVLLVSIIAHITKGAFPSSSNFPLGWEWHPQSLSCEKAVMHWQVSIHNFFNLETLYYVEIPVSRTWKYWWLVINETCWWIIIILLLWDLVSISKYKTSTSSMPT
jgi:hypothetical protein